MISLDLSDRSEILRYLGYRGGEISEIVEKNIEEAIAISNRVMVPRSIWKLCYIQDNENGLFLPEVNFTLTGSSIRKHLKGCDRLILFCVTLGNDMDIAIDKAMVDNPSLGVILNACGIAAVEKLADKLQKDIDDRLTGEHTGLRFSPGYGDLPLETQTDFIKALNCEKTIGVRLNANFLMNPQKSVTAVAGILQD